MKHYLKMIISLWNTYCRSFINRRLKWSYLLVFCGLFISFLVSSSSYATTPKKLTSTAQASVGSIGGACKIDGTCNMGGVCYETNNGKDICLEPTEDNSLYAKGCGCQQTTEIPFSFVFLFMVILLPYKKNQKTL